ncbi:MAG: polysaccharide deacetylase family protein [SAR202 cluster bacterium]|nr:polysaccharide deacetylase family protein [SAR202 cluster bacterium]
MRIPITMCHGIRSIDKNPMTAEHFDKLISIARELGFNSITYDELAKWRAGKAKLPKQPIMFDFDHPVKSMRYEVKDVMDRYGYTGNLFIYTFPYDAGYTRNRPSWASLNEHMTWDDIREMRAGGWLIGAHTISHPNLSDLFVEDPSGEVLRTELDRCNETIKSNLGFMPQDFAFTGTSWSSLAEREVKKRYRFGRLWIIGSEYKADGKPIRYAELVGVPGADEADGGPPAAARYITEKSDPYRLPSMELQYLLYEPDAFRRYLEGALV